MANLKQSPYILVTGGAGYIGSHTVLALKEKGYSVIVLDNLIYGHQDLVNNVLAVPFIQGDISDRALLDNLFATYNIHAVIHFAAYAYVGESVEDPSKYYRNNVVGTLTLLEAMLAANIRKIVFSSTCATYGVPAILPIPETHAQNPINPATTWLIGDTIHDYEVAQELGCKCVLTAHGHQSRVRLMEAGAPVIDNLAELPVFFRTQYGF